MRIHLVRGENNRPAACLDSAEKLAFRQDFAHRCPWGHDRAVNQKKIDQVASRSQIGYNGWAGGLSVPRLAASSYSALPIVLHCGAWPY